MSPEDSTLFYVALVLPALFAITLIIEGIHKIFKEESGIVALILGIFFLGVSIGAYFYFIS
jgi:hypothetical protein